MVGNLLDLRGYERMHNSALDLVKERVTAQIRLSIQARQDVLRDIPVVQIAINGVVILGAVVHLAVIRYRGIDRKIVRIERIEGDYVVRVVGVVPGAYRRRRG